MAERMHPAPSSIVRARQVFVERGGTLLTSEALRLGIHPRTLYRMRDEGLLERLDRGLFRLSDLAPSHDPDLDVVALKVPAGVICLISALSFHEITTQIPHAVYLSVPRGSESPRIEYPPLRLFRFGAAAYSAGIESHLRNGVTVRVYSAEKSIADCFKYRNKLGLDIAIESLKLYLQRPHASIDVLMRFARVCRVERVIRPYVEALL